MKKKIGIYEAKTSLSKLIRAVKNQKISFQISERGTPVAMLCPIHEADNIDDHMKNLESSGVLELPAVSEIPQSIAHVNGALKRFIEDRE